ncbi:MAG: DOMON-like domain-containing protein [Proteobacteria bacterium]|nr:DOMON-like domain-containing protein [Pseudomonadota bacterium]
MAHPAAPGSMLAHPQTPAHGIARIGATARLLRPAVLCCEYALHADLAQVRMPAARGQSPADGLWRHTCFEAFVAAPDAGGYYEFNFSPAGDWAAYRFAAYRAQMCPAAIASPPRMQSSRDAGQLTLTATFDIGTLEGIDRAPRLRLALAAVIEDAGGGLSYWALHHPPGKPDFHHPDGFVVELSAP